MSTAKHTEGPWDVNPLIDLDGNRVFQVVAFANGCPLATMSECGSETLPNARLMAAAPTTAQMAVDFTLLVERFFRGNDHGDARSPATESEVAEAMYALRAHITKATGGAQ